MTREELYENLNEVFRDVGGSGGDDDAVERGVGGQAIETVTQKSLDAERQLVQNLLGLEKKVALPLDSEHLGTHGGQHAGLIT